jgi:hypothetical protein
MARPADRAHFDPLQAERKRQQVSEIHSHVTRYSGELEAGVTREYEFYLVRRSLTMCSRRWYFWGRRRHRLADGTPSEKVAGDYRRLMAEDASRNCTRLERLYSTQAAELLTALAALFASACAGAQ